MGFKDFIRTFIGIPEVLAAVEQIHKGQDTIMSKVQDFATQEQKDFASIGASLDGIATEFTQLNDQIQALKNNPSGTLGDTDVAALAQISTASAALVVKAQALSAVVPPVVVGPPDGGPPPVGGPPAA